jgi:hypothetical protein
VGKILENHFEEGEAGVVIKKMYLTGIDFGR